MIPFCCEFRPLSKDGHPTNQISESDTVRKDPSVIEVTVSSSALKKKGFKDSIYLVHFFWDSSKQYHFEWYWTLQQSVTKSEGWPFETTDQSLNSNSTLSGKPIKIVQHCQRQRLQASESGNRSYIIGLLLSYQGTGSAKRYILTKSRIGV